MLKAYFAIKLRLRTAPLTINLLINYVYEWYTEVSMIKLKKSNIPVVTATILKKYFNIIAAVKMITTKFSRPLELRFKQHVFDLIETINTEFHMKKRQAPFITLKDTRLISKKLWTFVPKGRGFTRHSIKLRKEAAVHLLISALAGGRWNDIGKLKWEDIEKFDQKHGQYFRIMIRRSKNNLCNEQPQCVMLKYCPNLTLTSCPVQMLKALNKLNNRPTEGKIFETTSRARLTVTQKECNLNKIKFTGHSGRVSMAVTLRASGFGKDAVRSYMNWKTDAMPDYYSNIRAQMAENAPANVISDNDKITSIQETLI